eukprot:15355503-Ditylum_brightwellii.AAC.1
MLLSYSLGNNHLTIPAYTNSFPQFPSAGNIEVGDLIAVEDQDVLRRSGTETKWDGPHMSQHTLADQLGLV